MKAVILAGGLGTRISEESNTKPKPMIEIGGKPIIWHIMKLFSAYGVNDFIICCGYKGYVIKEYFANYYLHTSDITVDTKNNKLTIHNNISEPWTVTLVNTGVSTMTGGRLLKVKDFIDCEDFCFTYGDTLADINIKDLIDFHKRYNKIATVTAAFPVGRFGALAIHKKSVISFKEKPKGDGSRVNAGFFVLKKSAINYINSESTIWEKEPLEKLAKENQLMAFELNNFWQPMDTLRDKNYLDDLWQKNQAPWKR